MLAAVMAIDRWLPSASLRYSNRRPTKSSKLTLSARAKQVIVIGVWVPFSPFFGFPKSGGLHHTQRWMRLISADRAFTCALASGGERRLIDRAAAAAAARVLWKIK